ncbi:putative Translin associated factor X interacting N terminus [Trypanosoma vivax]|uniref:Translin-associated factor X-interacting protein 1 N-terminal domain-containing protein n=1 Tax=Trypanosoma vivax (strain Y486) TaxID=1055687 RepID=G0TX49_TRYVY|nr:putative Translin associated factor X interacting N terminus [Trypanosoma vivax]CCC48539.1 conserved hypothetical protein [Trypanosoma vivax Y486]
MPATEYGSTMPVRGVQHIASPCIPSVSLEAARHLPTLPYNLRVGAKTGNSLISTVPSATKSSRDLCDRNAPQGSVRGGVKSGGRNANADDSVVKDRGMTPRGPLTPFKGACATYSGGRINILGNTTVEGLKSLQPTGSLAEATGDLKTVAGRTMSLTRAVDQGLLGTVNMTRTVKACLSSRYGPPPLAVALESYVQKEVEATIDEHGSSTAQDRLKPFREALGVIIDAFPAYSKILNDIMAAYDSVIREQAMTIMDAVSRESQQKLADEEHRIEVEELNTTITKLMSELQEVKSEIEGDEGNEAADENLSTGSNRQSRSLRGYRKLEKNLADAKATIKAMESVNKDDLQKVLVLVNAVRESDKRAKELEEQVFLLNARLEGLSEFKIMAGETERQLEEMRDKFRHFVSLREHEAITEQLTSELAAAHAAARHNRRAAAIRGTQVDVMGRKLKAIQDENEQIIDASFPRDIYTPRPKWDQIQEEVPGLKERMESIKAPPLDGDEVITSTVPGMSETVLQVEYLVERIRLLTQELERRTMVPMSMTLPAFPFVGQCLSTEVPHHLRSCGIIPYIEMDAMFVLGLVYDFFREVLHSHPDVLLPSFNVHTHYINFLQAAMKTRPDMQRFACVEHIAVNLHHLSNDKSRCRAPLMLLSGILAGSYPPRLACDVITIIDNVVSELQEIAAEQKKTRLCRAIVSECISPLFQLKTNEEVSFLKEALGPDSSFDVASLCNIGGKFLSALFEQECVGSVTFYTNLVSRLTSYAQFIPQNGGMWVIAFEKIGQTINEIEPLTPYQVVKEITEKSTEEVLQNGKYVIPLSDVIQIFAAAPIIRRTASQSGSSLL